MFVVHFIHIRGARAYEQTNNPLTAYSCKFLAFTTRADSAALLTNGTMLSVWCPSDSLSLSTFISSIKYRPMPNLNINHPLLYASFLSQDKRTWMPIKTTATVDGLAKGCENRTNEFSQNGISERKTTSFYANPYSCSMRTAHFTS